MFISCFFLLEGGRFYLSSTVIFIEWEIFSLFGSVVVITLLLDWISLTFMGFVRLISSMVLFYRTSYISGDKFIYRFIMLVYLFVLSMLMLIISPNLIRILLGWDGLGLVSYCLVIYYQNEKSANAGMLTILSNRVGDVAILLRIAWLANYGSWNFYFLQLVFQKNDLIFILVILILAGITKSAQIPFSAWLPAAIAAPTPVSALVHSSTLVTAGVYLLIRFHDILLINRFLFIIGRFTIFISGLGANFEMDLKKIIALSTLRQLGVIIIILSLGRKELAFFHLLSHALFKSLLFLCAGVFIHGMGDIQDIRYLGGVEKRCPVSSFYFVACSLSLCGFPFLSGFYSKDAILESYLLMEINYFMFFSIILGTMFTVTYSIRLGYFLFFKNLGGKIIVHLGEENIITVPISVLFSISVVAGSLIAWFYFPSGFVYLPFFYKILVISLVGLIFFLFYKSLKDLFVFNIFKVEELLHYVGRMWFMPNLSTMFIMPLLKSGKLLIKYLDQGWVEYAGGQGSHKSVSLGSIKVDYFYFLNLKSYLLIFFMLFIFIAVFSYLNSLNRA